MKSIRARFERWLRRSRDPPSQGRARRGYRVVRLRAREREALFEWISYRPAERNASHPIDVDLWALRSGPLGVAAYHRACGDLELVRCVYDCIVERVCIGADSPARRLTLRANLVSPSVKPDRSLALVSQTGFRIRLWTYDVGGGSFIALPYCAPRTGPSKAKLDTLERLLRSLST